jgi:hypothetical protein
MACPAIAWALGRGVRERAPRPGTVQRERRRESACLAWLTTLRQYTWMGAPPGRPSASGIRKGHPRTRAAIQVSASGALSSTVM